MPIAELFLSSVVKTLLNQLGDAVLAEYARINGISDKLKSWKHKLRMIQAVMDSAEEKLIDGNSAIHQWLSDLRDVAYDMEDLLDEFSVEAKRSASKAQTLSAKLPSCLIACCSRIDPRTLISDHRIANEIEEVDQRLEEVLRQKDILMLVENSRSVSPANSSKPRFTTTCLSEPKFVGREKQMEELLNRLTGIEVTKDSVGPFTVVSIVGMGGLGKTTLAQQLYNHESVSNAFKVRAWACVSDFFDRVAITKSILECIAPSSPCEGKDLNWLQSSLKEQLFGKKFLIVLDDVWNDNYEEIESLLKPFYSGSSGSRILLTTRNRAVAQKAGDSDPKELELLLLNDCLSLLAYHAIGEGSFNGCPHLRGIAVKLATKCKGLPLAVKTLGGLLRFERNDKKWEDVFSHGIWERECEQEKIPPALKLSYVHLPIHLKRCFAACAIFPKDYLFDKDELIQLWIIQGSLLKGTAKTYRDVGKDYLRQLEDRSLLQKVGAEETRYSMHDLINDLAKSVVGVTYFSSDERGGTSDEESLAKVRHAAMVTEVGESCLSSRVNVYRSMKKLRTFMHFQISKYLYPNVFVSDKVIHDLLMDLKQLRMLSLCNINISKVPDSIKELKLLRSINFSHTNIEVLPESICELVKLQSLLLRGCWRLKKLPTDIHKLTNLLHLDITNADSLEEMPPHIGDLIDLEILSSFVVGNEAGRELKELGRLKCLQRELHIYNLLDVDNVGDARIANLHGKKGVSELSFRWKSNVGVSRDEEHQFMLLDLLQPPEQIECLSTHYYGGKDFPSWFGNSCMDNVVSLTLVDCCSVKSLPPFGRLPLLERLEISGLNAVSVIGADFYGTQTPFPSLMTLSIKKMPALKKWSLHEDYENHKPFPRLRNLDMRDCPLLETSGDTLSLPSLGKLFFESSNGELLKCLVDVSSMTEMFICRVPQLVRFDGSLSSSWVALAEIIIWDCPQFKSFVDESGGKNMPPKLKKLDIRNCGDLQKLPDDLYCLTSLNEMTVTNCHKLSSLPSTGLPPALRKLELRLCPILPTSQFISMRLPQSLEELTLQGLQGLTSITDLVVGTHLSQSLRILLIGNCTSFATLPDSLQHLSTLSELCVWDCEALELDCFPALPCNLSRFILGSCPKVKSLPQEMHNLTSLKELEIWTCNGITCLPRGGLPPNLEALHVINCKMMNQPLVEWGLARLTALQELKIGKEMGCVNEMVCFPSSSSNDNDAWHHLLPSSLVRLEIVKMKKLERIARGLRAHLTYLKELTIFDCKKMRDLPDDGLPDSFECLDIRGSDLLKERCSEPSGDYCPLLRLIPTIIF